MGESPPTREVATHHSTAQIKIPPAQQDRSMGAGNTGKQVRGGGSDAPPTTHNPPPQGSRDSRTALVAGTVRDRVAVEVTVEEWEEV